MTGDGGFPIPLVRSKAIFRPSLARSCIGKVGSRRAGAPRITAIDIFQLSATLSLVSVIARSAAVRSITLDPAARDGRICDALVRGTENARISTACHIAQYSRSSLRSIV